ncbi:MAG: 3-carboxy-cis,cis-muconate cycloisomerase, partial [Mesorhizobium sp.]
MTVSPFDHPLLSGLLGDEEAARHFSVEADIAAMLGFERALADPANPSRLLAAFDCGDGL